ADPDLGRGGDADPGCLPRPHERGDGGMTERGMTEQPVRVLYWFNQPTPYGVARFNAAVERPELDLHAVFSRVREPDRSWDVDESAWKFPACYLGRIKVP